MKNFDDSDKDAWVVQASCVVCDDVESIAYHRTEWEAVTDALVEGRTKFITGICGKDDDHDAVDGGDWYVRY